MQDCGVGAARQGEFRDLQVYYFDVEGYAPT